MNVSLVVGSGVVNGGVGGGGAGVDHILTAPSSPPVANIRGSSIASLQARHVKLPP